MQKQKLWVRFLLPWTLAATAMVLAVVMLARANLVKAATGTNQQLNYQARLLNSAGAVVADGLYNIEFKIYQDGNGILGGGDEVLKWTETREGANAVTVKNGYFSVYLGSVTPFADNIDWNQDTLWLSINIGGTGTPSYDGQMSPFTRLSSTPYALNAGLLNGLSADDFAQLSSGAGQGLVLNASSFDVNVSNGLEIVSDAVRINQDFAFGWTADQTWTLSGIENLEINHDLAGNVNVLNILGTPSTTAGTAYGLVIQQLESVNTNGFDAGLVIDNVDSDLLMSDGILVISGAGGIADAIDVSDPEITNAINIGTNFLVASGDSINDFSGDGLQVLSNTVTLALETGKGLTVDTNGLSLQDCSTNEVLKYNVSGQWVCAADVSGGSSDLDAVYANDPDKTLAINNSSGLVLNMTTTGNFVIQDNGATIANFDSNGGIAFTPNGASDVTFNFDDDSQLILNGTLTNSGALQDINLAFAADSGADTVSALNIDVTSANDTVSDIVYGVNIADLVGAGANTSERALRIGANWDQAIDANGILISLAELQILDANISLTSEVTGTLPVLNGGTNSTTAQGAINNLAGLTVEGDLLYRSGSNATRLARGSDGQCLTSNTSTIAWAGCGDNVFVNSSAATDLNFLNSSASATAAGITWSLATVPNPDDLTISIGAASGTVAGIVTANAQTIGGAKTFSAALSANGLTSTNGLTSSGTTTLSGLNCTTFSNGGKVTANASGVLSCANDVGSGTVVKSGTVSVTEGLPSVVTFSGTAFSVQPRCTISARNSGYAWVSSHTGTTAITIDWNDGSGGQPNTTTVEWICTDGSNADLAEVYSSNDTSIRAGDLVSIDPELKTGVKKSQGRYDKHLMGIVSTEPAITIGGTDGEGIWQAVVALAGRVPVKVNTENGPIKAGDWLTSSSVAGVAMKATKSGPVIGQAKADFNKEGTGLVMTFVNYGYFNGTSIIDSVEKSPDETEASYRRRVLNHLMSSEQQAKHQLDWSDVSTDRLVAGLEIVTPHLIAEKVTLSRIESVDAQVIEINSDVRINGTLYADRVEANQIVGLEMFTDKINSLSANVETLGTKIKASSEGTDEQSSPGVLSMNKYISLQNTSVLNLEVLSKLSAKGGIVVDGAAVFNNSVSFVGRATFNRDSGGFAKIHKGQNKVDIMFNEAYEESPSISVTSKNGQFVDYAYVEILEKPNDPKNSKVIGFSILLELPALKDVEFSWTALSIKNPQVSSLQLLP